MKAPLDATASSRAALASAAQADVREAIEFLGRDLLSVVEDVQWPTLVVDGRRFVQFARFLRDARGYQLLVSLTAVDCLPSEPRFQVVYHLAAITVTAAPRPGTAETGEAQAVRRLRVKVPVSDRQPVADSVVGVYPAANWLEREVYDLFGIEFSGHPDLRRIVMPDGCTGHPLRKDHPLGYERVAFSADAARIHGSKPRAVD